MVRVILGLFFIAFGLWGLFDEWYYVADAFKGFLPLLMVLMGVLSLAIVCMGSRKIDKGKGEV